MKKDSNDWGFDEPTTFSQKQYEKNLKEYHKPRDTHDCERQGCKGRYALENQHELQEVWDDFSLSYKQREDVFMDIVRARGRLNKESTLIRRFISTADGTYVIRMSSYDPLNPQMYGDIFFETDEEGIAYYNYCVNLFGFSKTLLISQEDDESAGFFDDLDDLDAQWDAMFEDDEGEDEFAWDTDEDEDEFSW